MPETVNKPVKSKLEEHIGNYYRMAQQLVEKEKYEQALSWVYYTSDLLNNLCNLLLKEGYHLSHTYRKNEFVFKRGNRVIKLRFQKPGSSASIVFFELLITNCSYDLKLNGFLESRLVSHDRSNDRENDEASLNKPYYRLLLIRLEAPFPPFKKKGFKSVKDFVRFIIMISNNKKSFKILDNAGWYRR